MAQRKIILTGGDTSANDAQPAGEQGEEFAVPRHTEMQTKRGIWNIESLEFTPLLTDKVYELAFVWAPLKIVGGTGPPGNPIALYERLTPAPEAGIRLPTPEHASLSTRGPSGTLKHVLRRVRNVWPGAAPARAGPGHDRGVCALRVPPRSRKP